MKTLLRLAACVLLLPQLIYSQGDFYYSNQYHAACGATDNAAVMQGGIFIQNDSIIIEDVINNQCCPHFAFKLSGIIDDSLYVVFADTTPTMMCDCNCDFEVRLNAGVYGGEPLQLNYNGHWFTVSAYKPLLQVGKKWEALQLIPGLDYSMPKQTGWRIDTDFTQAFCWNALFYNAVLAYGDTTVRYLREQGGRVYYIDENQQHQAYCHEALLYDFNAQVGDTLSMGYDSVKFVVVPIEKTEMAGRRVIALADVSEPESSHYVLWIEGIGDTRGLFESVKSTSLLGTYSVLTCCSLNDTMLYQNPDYPDCGRRPDYQFFIEEGKKWTIYTECTLPGNESYTTEYEITGDNIIDNPYAMRFYPFVADNRVYFQEENGRVYYHYDNTSYLIYDFSLNAGDSVLLGDPDEYTYRLMVDSVKYLQYGDEAFRKTMFLSDDFSAIVWVAGIGDLNSPLFYWMPLPTNGCSPIFTCCHCNDKIVYQNPDYPDCGKANSLSSTDVSQIAVYPNPTNKSLYVEGDITPQMTFQVMNVTGKIVHQGLLKHALDLCLKPGIYFLVLKDGTQVLLKEKLMMK